MAANRKETMLQALKSVWSRGGVAGFYQGLIPWVSVFTIGLAEEMSHISCRPGSKPQQKVVCYCLLLQKSSRELRDLG